MGGGREGGKGEGEGKGKGGSGGNFNALCAIYVDVCMQYVPMQYTHRFVVIHFVDYL